MKKNSIFILFFPILLFASIQVLKKRSIRKRKKTKEDKVYIPLKQNGNVFKLDLKYLKD